MAPIPGSVPVAGFFAPTDDTDTFAATDPRWAKGGFSNWDTLAEVLNIPAGRRRLGMLVSIPSSIGNGVDILKLINNPIGDSTLKTDWENILSSKTIVIGDLTIYIEMTGSDETGDGSQSNPYATIKYAYDSLPDVVEGTITFELGSGSFDLPDLDNTKVCKYFNINGHTTNLNNDVVFSDRNSGSRYEFIVDSDYNYEGKMFNKVGNTSPNKFSPVIKYDSNSLFINIADTSISVGDTYETHSVDTTLNIITGFDINTYCLRSNVNKVNINIGSLYFNYNTKYYYHNDLFISSFYIEQNRSLRMNGSFRRCVIFNNVNKYSLFTSLSIVKPNFYYSVALISRVANTHPAVQILGNKFSSFYIENYDSGFELMSHGGYKSRFIDSYWDYPNHFENLNNVIYVKSEDVSINFESSSYFNNVTNLLKFTDETHLRGLTIRLNEYQGTYPTNTLNAPFEEYKLFDEQVVNKVILPTISSSPVLELTTTERTSYVNPYEGQRVKDITKNKIYNFLNGAWVEEGSSNLNAYAVEFTNNDLTAGRYIVNHNLEALYNIASVSVQDNNGKIIEVDDITFDDYNKLTLDLRNISPIAGNWSVFVTALGGGVPTPVTITGGEFNSNLFNDGVFN